MRTWLLPPALLFAALAGGSDPASGVEHFQGEGRSLFFACRFKRAAQVLTLDPGNAVLSFWLGKSYPHLAELSTPLAAQRNARSALRYLEKLVASDPQNGEGLEDFFLFSLSSPAWHEILKGPQRVRNGGYRPGLLSARGVVRDVVQVR